jgi:OmcA/MtrC family decaheme c-type cytochrome
VITFQIKKDGVAVTALNVPTPVINGANGQTVVSSSFEPITGLVSGPTFYVAFAVPQDGITAPADFNASASVSLANLLVASGSPKAGSLSNTVTNGAYQADASGYFTATLTGNLVGEAKGTCTAPTAPATATCVTSAVLVSPIVIPTGATIVTGAMIGTFTQTNLAAYAYTAADPTKNANVSAKGGLVRNAVLQKMGAAGVAPRRTITATAKCAACHEQLGTDPSFHGGARNDPTACDICHNANKTSSGWSANASTFIHGIHGSSKRSVPFMWTAVSATDNYSKIGYPGLLKDCNQCHLPNTVNFGANGGTALTPNLLWPTAAAGTISTTSSTWRNSPYATAGVNYGNFFAYTPEGSTVAAYTPATAGLPTATAGVVTVAGTAVAAHVAGVGGESVVADPATLVNSPISSACFACHDTANAQTHIRSNGGKLYEPRANVTSGGKFVNGEDCLTCHGAGRIADVAIMHKK